MTDPFTSHNIIAAGKFSAQNVSSYGVIAMNAKSGKVTGGCLFGAAYTAAEAGREQLTESRN